MATNLSTIKTRVRRWIHETVEAESFFSGNLIINLTNASYRRRCSQIIQAFEGDFTQVALRDLVADKTEYAWPENFARCRRLDRVTEDGTRYPIPRFERHTEVMNPSSVEAQTFRPTGGGFTLEPTPSITVTNGLRIEFQAVPNELQADGDTLHADWPEIFTELLILDVVAYLLDTEGNFEDGVPRSALRARAEYEQDFMTWIQSKVIKRQEVMPEEGHYLDA